MAASNGKISPQSSETPSMPQGEVLSRVNTPDDVKKLSNRELDQLADDIRAALIESVTKTGGHLGASLGTVELAIALHYVFTSPKDKIVWDVGHQAYAHKILTGRKDRFPTLRKEGGMSGFLSRDESEHDVFGAGHASTSISAALGMCVAEQRKLQASQRGHAVAIIGDGALTGGMAFEALNNAGHLDYPLIVILNDNEMSIAPNVGAMSKYLNKLRTDPMYNRAKDDLAELVEKLPQGARFVDLGKRMKDSMKEFIYHKALFEELGFTYVGPIKGHNIPDLVDALKDAADSNNPVLVHIHTEKGKGYDPASNDLERSHAVSAPSAPLTPDQPKPAPKYQDVFAQAAIDLAGNDDRIFAITAAMPSGTSLGKFGAVYPERYFDVGIAEQHAVTFAAGLATAGLRPIVGIYSTFLQRAFDQIIHDVAIQRLPVIFGLDRAGFAGDDGRTHHGVFDLSYLRAVPNMVVMAPKDELELRHMMRTAVDYTAGPVAIRFPRGAAPGVDTSPEMVALPIGMSETVREGADVAIIAIGSMVSNALAAAETLAESGIEATVVNARFAKPLDEDVILRLADEVKAIVTVEENAVMGGFGSGILELLSARHKRVPTRVLGVPDRFFEQASQDRLRQIAGLDATSIADAVTGLLARETVGAEPNEDIRTPSGVIS
jgi:1-deoxy-D-xylulose-5-phosphate synthase